MANNVEADAGSGGATFATDEVSSVHYPVGKLAFGADGTATWVSTSAGLPVQQQGTWILGANSGVDIGDVDVASIIPGTAATNLGKAIDSAAGSTDTGVAILAVRDDALSSLTLAEGDYAPVRVDANGAMWVIVSGTVTVAAHAVTQSGTWTLGANSGVDIGDVTINNASGGSAVNIQDGGNSITIDGTVSNPANASNTASVPNSAVVIAGQDGLNVRFVRTDASGRVSVVLEASTTNIGDVDVLTVPAPLSTTGGGTEATALRVTLASDSTGVVSVDDNGGALTVDGTVAVTNSALTSIASDYTANSAISALAAQSGTWTVQPGNTANTTPWLVTDTPATSGGLLMHSVVSAASTNAATVKASAGQVFNISGFNLHTAPLYLKLYNKASAPAPASDTPVQRYLIPSNGTSGAGFTLDIEKGLAFGTGIAYILTTGIGDTDNTATSANIATINIGYK